MVKMTIVSIDSRRRIYLPKKLGIKADKAIILPRGDNFLMIPVPKDIIPIKSDMPTKKLRKMAEKKAKNETRNANRV